MPISTGSRVASAVPGMYATASLPDNPDTLAARMKALGLLPITSLMVLARCGHAPARLPACLHRGRLMRVVRASRGRLAASLRCCTARS